MMSEPSAPESPVPHVAVLGGGLAGLAAAREALGRRPCRLTLLEREERPGGLAKTVEIDGLRSDLGPHRIYSALPHMRAWFRDMLGEDLTTVERRSRMYFRERFLRYPPSPREWLGVLGPGELAKMAASWAWAQGRGAVGALGRGSFAGAMERAYGRALCEALVFPYVEKTWKTPARRISADVARARATMGGLASVARRALFGGGGCEGAEAMLRTFHYVRGGGIETLARRLAADVRERGGEIRCGCTAEGLEIEDGRVRAVFVRGPNGEAERLRTDFVFSTIPLPDLAAGALDAYGESALGVEALRAAGDLEFLNELLIFIVLRRDAVGEDHWHYFPEAEPGVNRSYEPRAFDREMARKGRTVLCAEVTSRSDGLDWLRDDAVLGEFYATQLSETGLFHLAQIERVEVRRIENAYPLHDLEYADRLRAVLRALRGVENLITLGRQGMFQHNNMDHAVDMGLRAARCFVEEEQPVEAWFHKEIPAFRKYRIVD